MKNTVSFGKRLNAALSYNNIDAARLAELLISDGINVDRYTVGEWIENKKQPTRYVMNKIDEILFHGRGLLFDDDFSDCVVALRNGSKPVTNTQFRKAVDHSYYLKKQFASNVRADNEDDIEPFEHR